MNACLKTSLMMGLGIYFSITSAASYADTTGNRYGYPVLYKSDISSAAAWQWANKDAKILDVRRVEEYAAGHPKRAYNVPFPHVTGSPSTANDESPTYIGYDISVDSEVGFLAADGKDGQRPIQDFVDYVAKIFPNKSTPILVLCATGHRSVQASNALAKYGQYTNVYNIWEGYNGQPKYAYTGSIPTTPLVQLDLNNDDVLDGKDRDGWAYFQNLPTETTIQTWKVDNRYWYLYKNLR